MLDWVYMGLALCLGVDASGVVWLTVTKKVVLSEECQRCVPCFLSFIFCLVRAARRKISALFESDFQVQDFFAFD